MYLNGTAFAPAVDPLQHFEPQDAHHTRNTANNDVERM
jgi:hypothetical protein